MNLLKISRLELSNREERLVNTMHVLGDQNRFKMFKLLVKGNHLCVTEIADTLGFSVPAASQHFRIFELVGLVDKKRDGQKVCYELKSDDPFVKTLTELI